MPPTDARPRGLGQHVGGMVLSGSPIPEMVPVRAGAMEGRHVMDWNKDSVADANLAKIDLLSLPLLDQLDEALNLIEAREGIRPGLSRTGADDPAVYDMINVGRSKGVFLIQSPAQLKMAQRLKSRNLLDLAYQVALIRPGLRVQGSAVSQFVERYRHGAPWQYEHPLEERALARGCGVIVWQEQVVQLITEVAGMTAAQADEIRRAFAKPNNAYLIARHRRRLSARKPKKLALIARMRKLLVIMNSMLKSGSSWNHMDTKSPKSIAFGFIKFRHSRESGNLGPPRFLQPLPGRDEVASASTISPIFRPLDSRFRGNDGLFFLRRPLCVPNAIALPSLPIPIDFQVQFLDTDVMHAR